MKTIKILTVISILALGMISSASARTVSVRGYYKKSGTYVIPSYRTSPNHTKLDNYSTKGNYNPYTGKNGKVNAY